MTDQERLDLLHFSVGFEVEPSRCQGFSDVALLACPFLWREAMATLVLSPATAEACYNFRTM